MQEKIIRLQQKVQRLQDQIRSLDSEVSNDSLKILDTIDTQIFSLVSPDTFGTVNRAYADFFGLKKDDMAHKNLHDVLAARDADVCIASNTELFASGKQVSSEEEMTRHDGERRLISFTKSPRFSREGEIQSIVCTGEDITERREAERLLSLTKFSIDNVKMAVFWCHEDGSFFYVNETGCRWLGYSAEELQNMHVADINPEFPKDNWDAHWQEIKRHGFIHMESVHQRKNGEIYPVELFTNYVNFEGKDFKLSFVNDITERLRLEKQVAQAQKMRAMGTLSAGIAHDFNNILQTILGGIQLLVKGKTSNHPDYTYLTLIEDAVDRAQDLTSRLRYFSRTVEVDLKPVNLNAELPNLVHLLERSVPKMVRIVQEYETGLKLINADIVQIEQIVLNLTINASHAMPEGGVLNPERRKTYDVDECCAEDGPDIDPGIYVVLTVSDTGIGIDEETQTRIYEPFFTTKSGGEGSGLGLSMVYGIVKNHGGAITCSSTPGKGTSFRVYFPVSEKQTLSAEIEKPAKETPLGGSETILIVDDEAALLNIARDSLEWFGYRCVKCNSGEKALQTLAEDEHGFDLVLLDLNMPGMGGYKCLELIAKLEKPPAVVVASGYAANGNIKKIRDTGASAFLQKPYQVNELASTVRRVLDARSSRIKDDSATET